MTVSASTRLSQLYVGNNINTRFDFSFPVFNQEGEDGVLIRLKNGESFETIDKTLYTLTLNENNLGGHVDFKTPPSSISMFYIVGYTPSDQALDITNYDNFYPEALEKALDKLTAILQEWSTRLDQEAEARKAKDIELDQYVKDYVDSVLSINNPEAITLVLASIVKTTINGVNYTQQGFNEFLVEFINERYPDVNQFIDESQAAFNNFVSTNQTTINNTVTQAQTDVSQAISLIQPTVDAAIANAGNMIGAANKAALDLITDKLNNQVAMLDNGDIYRFSKPNSSPGTWVFTGFNYIAQAKGYTDEKITALRENFIVKTTTDGFFILTLDNVPLLHILSDGRTYLCGDRLDLREQVKNIPTINSSPLLFEFKDAGGDIVGYVDQNLNLFFGSNMSIQQQITDTKKQNNLNLVLNSITDNEGRANLSILAINSQKYSVKKVSTIVEPFPNITGQVQRIPAILRLANNKILYMWGGGAGSPYNGDAEGVRLYKRIISYDDYGFITNFGIKELFRETPLTAGIAKHPMLGRTASGRIVLIWDERNTAYSTTNTYSTMIAFSDDEGVTFTEPVQIPNNPAFTFQIVGSTGTIVTMPNGRLVCPMYYTLPYQTIGMMYSDNNGTTWQYGSVLNISGGVLQEPSISLDVDNNIIVSSRSTFSNRRKHISKSVDGGQTLTDVGFNQYLVSPNVASSIFYDSEKKIMLHSTPTGMTRTAFKIQLSADNGVTWKIGYLPYSDNLYVGYSQIIKLSTDLYAIAVEGLTETATVNSKESVGILIFNLNEVFNNVS